LLLSGSASDGKLEREIPFSDLVEVRVGRGPTERLNGYRTDILERETGPVVRVAPLGMAVLSEITDLLASLTRDGYGSVLAVCVPLKPGCLGHARELLAKGPPLDPASLGLSGHEVYLSEGEAVFVFRGADVHAQVNRAIRHPAVWRAGVAWQRCFARPPQVIDRAALLNLDAEPAYRWLPPSQRVQGPRSAAVAGAVISSAMSDSLFDEYSGRLVDRT
jgi:hypothetical protein